MAFKEFIECYIQHKYAKNLINEKYIALEQFLEGVDQHHYSADKEDEVDVYLGHYCNATGIDMGLKRIERSLYSVGSMEVEFVMVNNMLQVRAGGSNGKKLTDGHEFLDGLYLKKINMKNNSVDAKLKVGRSSDLRVSSNRYSLDTDVTMTAATTPGKSGKASQDRLSMQSTSPIKFSP